jgi:small-conductance mechanosensitive channel
MRADNSRHIIDAAHRRSQLTRAKAIQALRDLDAAGQPVTFHSVATHAGVSRSWLYNQPDLRAEIDRLRATHRRAPASPTPAHQRASNASLLRRLETANERLRQLREDNHRLREQIARLLGEQRTATGKP